MTSTIPDQTQGSSLLPFFAIIRERAQALLSQCAAAGHAAEILNALEEAEREAQHQRERAELRQAEIVIIRQRVEGLGSVLRAYAAENEIISWGELGAYAASGILAEVDDGAALVERLSALAPVLHALTRACELSQQVGAPIVQVDVRVSLLHHGFVSGFTYEGAALATLLESTKEA